MRRARPDPALMRAYIAVRSAGLPGYRRADADAGRHGAISSMDAGGEVQPMDVAETAGLVLRRPRESDIEPLMAMDADPEVMRYIGSGAVVPPDRDRRLRALARWRQQWDEQGFGMCSVIVRESGEYVGWVTLAVPAFLPEILPAVEIGWRLRREHWGRGYATEAAAELLRFGFGDAGLDRVVSIRHVDNARSERVMNKLGLRFEFQATVPATGQPVAVHAITRRELAVHNGHGTA